MFTFPVKVIAVFIILGFEILNSCGKETPPKDLTRETAHFTIIANTNNSSEVEVNDVGNKAEELFSRLEKLLGDALLPGKKIKIRLEGTYTTQGPYFDPAGIHLFRYSQMENGYLALLAHELGHAFREDYYIDKDPYNWPIYPFLDEGFAEYLAQMIDPDRTGFPFYGFQEDVVVGAMVKRAKHITPEILRQRHLELNDPCNIQAYTTRASWISHIHEVFGWEALQSLIYAQEEPTSSSIQEMIGVDLPTLDQDWETWILAKYQKIEHAEQIAAGYEERTSWYTYCNP